MFKNKISKKKKLPLLIAAIISLSFVFAAIVPVGNTSAGIVSIINKIVGNDGPCYRNGGALGWVLCPALGSLTDLLQYTYTGVVNQLQLPASTLFSDGLKTVWSTFRDISNVIFVILFLFVIISQLTGFGIDNYGIKKTLPRIIIVAILINLSYIICQVAVDVSNIVGASMKGFLVNLANSIEIADPPDPEYSITFLIDEVNNIALAIPLGLVTQLTACIVGGIIFIIASLAGLWMGLLYSVARTVGIVLCVALSPLAFASFLLPNTEKLFKKWLELMKNLLMIYPICSALLGAGFLIGKMLTPAAYTSEGITGFINTMIVTLAPTVCFFMIPKVLKGSLASMGMVGKYFADRRAKHGITRKARARRAMNAAKNSQAAAKLMQYKNIKVSGANRRLHELSRKGGALGIVGKVGAAATTQAAVNARQQNVGLKQKEREFNKWSDQTVVTGEGGKPVWVDNNGNEVAAGTTGAHQLTRSEEYARQLERQGETAYNNEQVRMYADRFSVQSRGENNTALEQAIRENNPQKFAAAFRTLIQQGGTEEALNALYHQSASIQGNAEMRRVAEQEMATAGNPIMKEFIKNQAQSEYKTNSDGTVMRDAAGNPIKNDNRAENFADFIDKGHLTRAFQAKGDSALVGMDKDNLSFINTRNNPDPKVGGKAGTIAFSSAAIANAASATTNGEEIERFRTMIEGLTEPQRQEIIGNMSGSQMVNMNNAVRIELAQASGLTGDELKRKLQTTFAAQIKQIESDPNLSAKVTANDRELFGIGGRKISPSPDEQAEEFINSFGDSDIG